MTNESRKAPYMNRLVYQSVTAALVCALGLFVGLSAVAADAPNEDQLISVLKSNAGWQEKYTACTQLRQIGTAKSVPALAALLTDEKLSHMARYALEPMPFPEATDALRAGLKKTKGLQRVGVMTSLGVKKDAKSVPAIAKSLKDKDPAVARAAAAALGRIGTVQAALILAKYQKKADPAVRGEAVEGLLAAAENLTANGNSKIAVGVCTPLLEDKSSNARLGAFRVLVHAEPANAPALIAKALGGNDDQLRNFAAQAVAETPGKELTAAFAAALPSLPAAGQVALVRGLGDRKDPVARAAVLAAMAGKDKDVQLAAVKALSTIGTPEDVAPLAAILAGGDADLIAVTKKTLATIENKDLDAAIAGALGGVTPPVRAILIDVQSERMAPQAVASSIAALADADMAVRVSALHTLTKLGAANEAPAVIETLKKATDASERGDAADALNAIASESGEALLPVITGAMKGANAESQVALLTSLGRIGTPKALAVAVDALKSKDAALRDAAVRVVAGWPTVDAAPELIKLAKAGSATQKDAALRGYVRLAQAEQNADAKVKMLGAAMGIAKTKEEKWLILPAWGAFPSKQSLDTLVPMLADAETKNEVATALITAATNFAKADPANKPAAAEAVKAVLAKVDDATIKERATKTLETLK